MQAQFSLFGLNILFVICFCRRINLDCIQAEANALSKRLRDTEKKVSSTVQDVKDQFLSIIKVSEILYTIHSYTFLLFILDFNHA